MIAARRLTVSDVARLAGVTEQAIRGLNQRGRMPAGERTSHPGTGPRWEWDESVILEWLPTRRKRGRPRKDPTSPVEWVPSQNENGSWAVGLVAYGRTIHTLPDSYPTEHEARSFVASLSAIRS